jgi:uncharacterized spore protein YtfJ
MTTGTQDTRQNGQMLTVARLVEQARSLLTVERVYGEPVERDGVTVIPAAAVRGGGGGGGGGGRDAEGQSGQGEGMGFGLEAKPVGAFVIREGEVSWEPAVDITRIVLAFNVLALALVVAFRRVAKIRAKRS